MPRDESITISVDVYQLGFSLYLNQIRCMQLYFLKINYTENI